MQSLSCGLSAKSNYSKLYASAETVTFGTVAQFGEHLIVNQHVVGSIPTGSVRPAHYRIDESMRSMPRRKKLMPV